MSDLNDPRVLFAAERTLMAWNRTTVSLMVFGFVIERFGIFLQLMRNEHIDDLHREISFLIGESFVLLAIFISFYSIWQFRKVIKSLRPAEFPNGYNFSIGVIVNAITGGLGLVLSIYLANSLT